ncbi:MAG: hypothetical protein LBP59_16590, partial [Planctomycetaceae bacterium]|nr:hypothetical protein [Planctomycetaceae bacterium]
MISFCNYSACIYCSYLKFSDLKAGISKNSFVQVGGVSPKRRNRVYDTNKFYYFIMPKRHLLY